MARQVRSKMGWNEGSNGKMAHGSGFLGIIRNILRLDHRTDESTFSIAYGSIEGLKAHVGFASVKEAEALLRIARMLK